MRVAESIRSTHNGDGAIVLDIKHGRIFGLNLVASRILELLRKNYEQAEIALEISREFGVSPQIVSTDVHEFLEVLEKHKMIEIRAGEVSL